VTSPIILTLLTWAFFAGGAWFLLRQIRRDVNGLGLKVRNVGLAVQLSAPSEKKDEIARLIATGRCN